MLARIQRRLAALYDLEPMPDVECFVCGPELAAELAGDDAARRREVLLVLEDDDGVHVALYLAPEVLAELARRRPAFDAVQLATEGVSHFLYLAFRERNAEPVSRLELELQAEVDKYAVGLGVGAGALAGNGVGVFRERQRLLRERSRVLRERLFARARFLDDPGTDEGERYRLAHRAAARYAAQLEARYVDAGRLEELALELRRFYRVGARDKLALAAQ
ncbi:MAG: hypothetical protein KF729_20230 [Sandaracinaceae bacterium]|nr:hypothetical protein [Sandaracinaceae bacterium]